MLLTAALAVLSMGCGDDQPNEPEPTQEPTVVGSWDVIFRLEARHPNPELKRILECNLGLEIPAEIGGAFSGELTTITTLFERMIPPGEGCGEQGSRFSDVAGAVTNKTFVRMTVSRNLVSLAGCAEGTAPPELTGAIGATQMIMMSTFDCENEDTVGLGVFIEFAAGRI